MAEPNSQVFFVTQSRIASKARTDEWHDACSGHTDFYEAVECVEKTKAALDGKDNSPKAKRFSDFVKAGLSPLGSDARLELQVVKRTITITDEVVDAVACDTAEAPDAR